MRTLLLLFLAWNLTSFLVFGWDKWRARRRGRRVPERRLLLLAFLLGAPGAWLGVRTFRHKTGKMAFLAWLRVALGFNLALLAAFLWWRIRG